MAKWTSKVGLCKRCLNVRGVTSLTNFCGSVFNFLPTYDMFHSIYCVLYKSAFSGDTQLPCCNVHDLINVHV